MDMSNGWEHSVNRSDTENIIPFVTKVTSVNKMKFKFGENTLFVECMCLKLNDNYRWQKQLNIHFINTCYLRNYRFYFTLDKKVVNTLNLVSSYLGNMIER